MPDLRTIEGVELARVGTYQLSTGPMTFTREHLASAVEHAEAAPQAPRVKLGHVDPRFDGEPALGVVRNVRLNEDGDVLVGDLEGIPAWLADSMPTAYPGRSIEAAVRGDGMRLTALSLLGVTPPGIDTLADLELALAAAAAAGEPADVVAEPERLVRFVQAAHVSAGDVERAWRAAKGPDTDWWIREVYLDPVELIVSRWDDDALWRVPVDTAGDNITFGDPERVVVQYVAASEHRAPAATFNRPEGPEHMEASSMDPKKLRSDLGLPEDATDEQVTARITELSARPTTAQVAEQVAAAKAPEGVALVDEAELANLKAAAQVGVDLKREIEEQTDDRILAAAAKEGRFAPARLEHYRKALKEDREGTRHLLTASPEDGGLAPGLVPVGEVGVAASADAAAGGEWDAVYRSLGGNTTSQEA